MSEEYVTPDYFDHPSGTMEVPAKDIPSGADFMMPIAGDGMEPVFHDGQYVFVQRCTSLFPFDPGVFLVDGKAFLRLYTEQNRKKILTTYENRREPIEIGPETDFHIIGRVLRR